VPAVDEVVFDSCSALPEQPNRTAKIIGATNFIIILFLNFILVNSKSKTVGND